MQYIFALLFLGVLLALLYHKTSEIYTSVRQERDILKSKLKYIQEDNNRYGSEISQLKIEVNQKQEKIDKITEERDALTSSNLTLTKEKRDLALEISQLQTQLKNYERT